MRAKLFAATVCLIIVAQCLFTPMTYAITPIEDEISDVSLYNAGGSVVFTAGEQFSELFSGGFMNAYYTQAKVVVGYPVVGENIAYENVDFNKLRFAHEGTTLTGDTFTYSRKSGDYYKDPETGEYVQAPPSMAEDGRIPLPGDESLGRVPDVEFDGWYVYGGMSTDVNGKYDGTATDSAKWSRFNPSRDISHDISINKVLWPTGMVSIQDGFLLVKKETAKSLLQNLIYQGTATYFSKAYFPVVGGWKDSANATATAVQISTGAARHELYAYDANTSISTPSTALVPVSFADGVADNKYYIRVGGSVDSVTLDLTAFEPFLNFEMAYSSLVCGEQTGTNGTNTLWAYRYAPISDVLTASAVGSDPTQVAAVDASPLQIKINGKTLAAVAEEARAAGDAVPTLRYSVLNGGTLTREFAIGDNNKEHPVREVWQAENSASAPARSNWVCANIPIERASADRPCNEVVVTITAPDGKTTKSYSFYIHRVADFEVSMNPGNTPAGVVARDPDALWRTGNDPSTVEANKQAWLDYFTNSESRVLRNSRVNGALRIRGGVYADSDTNESYDLNNAGCLYDGSYWTSAWGTREELANGSRKDLDIDPNAVVVYMNYAFEDPGFDIIMSNGSVYADQAGGKLERRIALDTPAVRSGAERYSLLDALAPAISGTKTYDTVYYRTSADPANRLVATTAANGWETIKMTELGVDLRDLAVLPGVYKIEYRFTDPYTKAVSTIFERQMAVITIPGDVDMDGVTTLADSAALRYLVSGHRIETNGKFVNDRMALFALRVCNVSGTRGLDVDESDVDELRKGFRPYLRTTRDIGVSDYFYFPLSSPDLRYERVDTLTSASSGALLELGGGDKQDVIRTGTLSSAMSVDDVSESPMSGLLTLPSTTMAAGTGLQLGDVFWVEMNVGDLSKYTNINNFTCTLSYDSKYIRPATRTDMEEGGYAIFDSTDARIQQSYRALGGEEWAKWAVVMHKYNLRISNEPGATVWAHSGDELERFTLNLASTPSQSYQPHFSKLLTEFEKQFKDSSREGDLKEVVFSIRSTERAETAANQISFEGNTVLLRIPFYMHTFPTEFENQKMPLVSLDLGMQEMVFIDGGDSLLANSQSSSYQNTLSTIAFSTQSSIYGGLTDNLRDDIKLTSTTMEFQIAKDTTDHIELLNENNKDGKTLYGDSFKCSSILNADGSSSILNGQVIYSGDESKLPPGITYERSSGTFSGTPTKAGVYRFRLGSTGTMHLQITVEKQPIHIHPVSVDSYYGENDFKDDTYSDAGSGTAYIGFDSFEGTASTLEYRLQYVYNVDDIKETDITRYYDQLGIGTLESLRDPDRLAVGNRETAAELAAKAVNNLTGSMNELGKIIGGTSGVLFGHPKLSAGRTSASQTGVYPITITTSATQSAQYHAKVADALLENYYLVVDDSQTASVTVLKRPIQIEKLNYEEAATAERNGKIAKITIDDTDTVARENAHATLSSAKTEFSITTPVEAAANPALDGSSRKLYKGRPLTSRTSLVKIDDELTIEYSSTFVLLSTDKKDGSKNFTVGFDTVESRDVEITGVRLSGGSSFKNYTLDIESGDWAVPNQPLITNGGYVRNIPLLSVSINDAVNTTITYGDDGIELSGRLSATLTYTYGTEPVLYTETSFAEKHLYVSLVRAKGDPTNNVIDGADEERAALAADGVQSPSIPFGSSDISSDVFNANNYVAVPHFTGSTKLPAMNGEYCLRIAYAQMEEDTGSGTPSLKIYKTAYSKPIIVNKKDIIIRLLSEQHYYGETPTFKYIFAISDLATAEQNLVSAKNREVMDIANMGSITCGSEAALEEALGATGWTKPKMVAVDTGAHRPTSLNDFIGPNAVVIDANTPVSGRDFYIGIYGAEHNNYNFVYRQIYQNIGATIPTSSEFGFNFGRVEPRPIVVDKLHTSTDPLATVYSDTLSLTITGQSYANAVFGLPPSADGVTEYFEKNPDSMMSTKVDLPLNNEKATIGDDAQYLEVYCDIVMLNDYVTAQNMHSGYFSMTKDASNTSRVNTANGENYCHATTRNMTLAPHYSSANPTQAEKDCAAQAVRNYKLVYADYTTAKENCPKTYSLYKEQRTTLDENGVYSAEGRVGYTYTLNGAAGDNRYVVGHVKLLTRKITKVEIITAPNQTKYTYGDGFAPLGLTVKLTFDTTYGPIDTNRDPGDMTLTSGSTANVAFDRSGNVFPNYGLSVELVNGNDDHIAVKRGDYITPAANNGNYIAVHAQRCTGHTMVHSAEKNFVITVLKKDLPLYPVDQYRFYGEPNYSTRFVESSSTTARGANYEFYFNMRDLVEPDRDKVADSNRSGTKTDGVGFGYAAYDGSGTNKTIAKTNGGNSVCALYDIDPTVKLPTFRFRKDVTVDKYSPVIDEGARGYDLYLTGDGQMSNYNLVNVDASGQDIRGTIYVYPRPIEITKFYAGNNESDKIDRSLYAHLTESAGSASHREIPYYDDEYSVTSASASFSGYTFTTSTGTYSQKSTLDKSEIQPNYNGGDIDRWYWFDLRSYSNSGVGPTPTKNFNSTAISWAKFYISSEAAIQTGTVGSKKIYDNIMVDISVSVPNYENDKSTGNSTFTAVRVNSAKLVENNTVNDNYRLVATDTNGAYAGRIDLRSIDKILIYSRPNKSFASYTYGEALDLSGLVVWVYYTGDSNARVVNYADFSQYGLSLNYYPANSNGSAVTSSNIVTRDDFTTYYRRALNGDHLTIAPMHDPDNITNNTVYKPFEFAHNGMYLVVTAQRGSEHEPIHKVIAPVAEGNTENMNAAGEQIKIAPKELDFTLTAMNKDYDGTKYAVGSITLKQIYTNDLVYIKTGDTTYETNWTWKNKDMRQSYLNRIAEKGYVFSSGTVTRPEGATNSVLAFSDAKGWGNTLTFEFADPNVRYNDYDAGSPADTYPANIGTEVERNAELNRKTSDNRDYWTTDQRYAHDEWKYEAAAMPLNVRNLELGGPDAANYTFRSGATGDAQFKENILYANGENTREGQASAPYAVINKAVRTPLAADTLKDEQGGDVRPRLEIDDATGVVRLLYSNDALRGIAARDIADNRSRIQGGSSIAETDIADKYGDELHLEFAIEFFRTNSMSLGDVEYYFGNESTFSDKYYFGGEPVTALYPADDTHPDGYFYPDGFESDPRDPSEYTSGELYGQQYKWSAADMNIYPDGRYINAAGAQDRMYYYDEAGVKRFFGDADSDKLVQYLALDGEGKLTSRDTTWELDEGFVFHIVDKNVEPKSVTIDGETYYYFYGYYTTERSPIPRGAYVIGKVRLSETHNYKGSAPLYSSEDYCGVPTPPAGAAEGEIAALLNGAERKLQNLFDDTDAEIEAYNAYIAAVSKNSRDSVAPPTYADDMSDMLRMPGFRIEIRSASDKQNMAENAASTDPMDVRVLRAVRFTDYSIINELSELRVVLYEDKNGYWTGYYWDDRYQNALQFDGSIELGVPITLKVNREEAGGTIERDEIFNSGNVIPFYITEGTYNNPIERWIKIHPDKLTARVGDDPIRLEVEFYPKLVANMTITWETSDDRIAVVDEDGWISFVGVGRATITATSRYGRISTLEVTVHEKLPPMQEGVSNFERLALYMNLDSKYFFHPDREMTRGELVTLAAMFFIMSDEWDRFGSGEFIDIVGTESYAEAVALLGKWGIVNGVGEGAFAGEQVATRAEAAAIIARMLGIDPSRFIGKGFTDNKATDTWASGYIGGLNSRGIVIGDGDSTFRPNDGITRAEAAMMFYRLLNYKNPKFVYRYPADVPESHWAYSAVLRAINPGEPVLDDGTQREKE